MMDSKLDRVVEAYEQEVASYQKLIAEHGPDLQIDAICCLRDLQATVGEALARIRAEATVGPVRPATLPECDGCEHKTGPVCCVSPNQPPPRTRATDPRYLLPEVLDNCAGIPEDLANRIEMFCTVPSPAPAPTTEHEREERRWRATISDRWLEQYVRIITPEQVDSAVYHWCLAELARRAAEREGRNG